MTGARSQLVDLDVTSYYHCISRRVRRACLCGQGYEHRKQWIEDRLEELAGIFAVSVAGFAVLDNHLRVIVRLEGAKLTDTWKETLGRLFSSVFEDAIAGHRVCVLPCPAETSRNASGPPSPGQPERLSRLTSSHAIPKGVF